MRCYSSSATTVSCVTTSHPNSVLHMTASLQSHEHNYEPSVFLRLMGTALIVPTRKQRDAQRDEHSSLSFDKQDLVKFLYLQWRVTMSDWWPRMNSFKCDFQKKHFRKITSYGSEVRFWICTTTKWLPLIWKLHYKPAKHGLMAIDANWRGGA